MFERKNHGVLSGHYNKLVDHASEASGSEEDFITLKRADHDLPSTSSTLPVEENISNRRRRATTSKRGQLKYGATPTRLIFDDDGIAHQVLEMKAVEDIFGVSDAKRVALETGRSFGEKERVKMSEVDRKDKAEARDKRKEKKRKRKESERAVGVLTTFHPLFPLLTWNRNDWGVIAPMALHLQGRMPRMVDMSPRNLT
jgi:ATP-dependent RNA helicase DDX10/DBP4